jgi:hypothetical protein
MSRVGQARGTDGRETAGLRQRLVILCGKGGRYPFWRRKREPGVFWSAGGATPRWVQAAAVR